MPIEIAKLKEKKRPLEERIRDVFARHRGKALTLPEIVAGAEQMSPEHAAFLVTIAGLDSAHHDPMLGAYGAALARLRTQKVVVEIPPPDQTPFEPTYWALVSDWESAA